MQKTVVVAVSYCVWVPRYQVYEKRVSRHMVGGQQGNIGQAQTQAQASSGRLRLRLRLWLRLWLLPAGPGCAGG
jgi:hypothetical protein